MNLTHHVSHDTRIVNLDQILSNTLKNSGRKFQADKDAQNEKNTFQSFPTGGCLKSCIKEPLCSQQYYSVGKSCKNIYDLKQNRVDGTGLEAHRIYFFDHVDEADILFMIIFLHIRCSLLLYTIELANGTFLHKDHPTPSIAYGSRIL